LRLVRTLVACSLVVGVLALPAAETAAAKSPGQKVAGYVNKIRKAHGLRPLKRSRSLWASSGRYARWMMRRDVFGHRANIAVSHRFRIRGETLAMQSGWRVRCRKVVRQWIHSPAHRRLLLSSRFTWIGVGRARGRMGSRAATTWVAHFGKL
jgi:uncharacterized protein YkwD